MLPLLAIFLLGQTNVLAPIAYEMSMVSRILTVEGVYCHSSAGLHSSMRRY
jgi:hypothetical protein